MVSPRRAKRDKQGQYTEVRRGAARRRTILFRMALSEKRNYFSMAVPDLSACRKSSTSFLNGMPGRAPIFVQQRAATALA